MKEVNNSGHQLRNSDGLGSVGLTARGWVIPCYLSKSV